MPSLEELSSDQLLEKAKAYEPQAQLMAMLLANPETRETVQRAMKKANPKLIIPEIDARDAVEAAQAKDRERIASLEAKLLENDVNQRISATRAKIKEDFKATDADIEEIEKLMVTDKIGTHIGAAKVYFASKQSAQPTPALLHSPTFDMPSKDDWAAGIGNPAKLNKVAMDLAFKAWNEATGAASGSIPKTQSNLAPAKAA